ncbi:MAG: AmpG family muropeptide MFS transporter [Motiliproteus sp.]|nr:AmpG family muropeptide MFS transporter [Motiliproteus sp.]MCW9051028.1 AmpG family muropeptide MFS transporter [Motiliproteus sp.]
MSERRFSWREALLVYTKPQVIALWFLGFSAGLPFLLVFSTLSAWLRDYGVSRSAIGFFAWVGITYSIKVLWAPVVDRIRLPLLAGLGKRRSWMLLGQLGIAIGLAGMALAEPQNQLTTIALLALLVAFSSSTQDISIDAYRIEAAVVEYQGAMSAAYIFGYRVALLVAGAGALYIADAVNWPTAYLAMAALMGVGIVTVLVIKEPDHTPSEMARATEQQLHRAVHLNGENSNRWQRLQAWLLDAMVAPFVEFFRRNGVIAMWLLLFISVYRLSDITMGIMANPFYLDLGFSKSDIATIGKVYGFVMTIIGSMVGGLLVVRYGVYRPLLMGAVLVASTNVLFAQLANVGADISWLTIVISADNFSGGLSSTAFIAYLSSLTNRAYTATQYALFSSLMTLPGKFVSGFSGVVVDSSGYFSFFIYAALLGIPAILLAIWLLRRQPDGVAMEVNSKGG